MKKDILLIIREEQKSSDNFITLLYTFDEKKDDYVLSPYLERSENGFVIHAITQHSNISQEDKKKLINQINRMGLITTVMANMASHHQYSGFKLGAIKENPFTPLINHSHKEISKNAVLLESTFSLLKEIAYEYGYSEQNAAIFFIRHIFCDRLDRQVRFALDNIFYSKMSENLLMTGHSPINTLSEAISC